MPSRSGRPAKGILSCESMQHGLLVVRRHRPDTHAIAPEKMHVRGVGREESSSGEQVSAESIK